MKKLMKSVFVMFALGLILTSCGGDAKKEEHSHEGHSHEHTEATTKYACPMKCEGDKTYEEKGSCPVCHMDLELEEVK